MQNKIYTEINIRHKKHVKLILLKKVELEKANKAETILFNIEWLNKSNELDEKFIVLKKKSTIDQKKEVEDKIYTFNSDFPRNPKPSADIINYNKIIKQMIKQKQYDKATNLHLIKNELISNDQLKWDVVREKKIKYELDIVKVRHNNDMLSLGVKMKKNVIDFKKNRVIENEKLCQKYKNKMLKIDLNHKIELSEFKNINVYNSKLLSGEISSIFKLMLEEASKNKVISLITQFVK